LFYVRIAAFAPRISLLFSVIILMVAFMGNSTILAATGQIQNEGNLSPHSRISLDADLRGLTDPNLKLEVVAQGLGPSTAMAFLGNSSNDILVTEQNTGEVRRIIDGRIQQEPLIDVAVANDNGSDGRGLLPPKFRQPQRMSFCTLQNQGEEKMVMTVGE
jgi:glucose/arabinose dehydrogenase